LYHDGLYANVTGIKYGQIKFIVVQRIWILFAPRSKKLAHRSTSTDS
jgi:hypothetical protein